MKVIWNILLWCLSKLSKGCKSCRPIVIACLGVCIGCTSQQRYVEGTMTQIGVFAPYDGQIYGANIVNYLNGVSVSTYTNQPMTVSREYCSSNTYFGVIHTSEHSTTTVEVKK